jgi:hypothetical protein
MVALHLEESKQDIESILVIVTDAGVGSHLSGKCRTYLVASLGHNSITQRMKSMIVFCIGCWRFNSLTIQYLRVRRVQLFFDTAAAPWNPTFFSSLYIVQEAI